MAKMFRTLIAILAGTFVYALVSLTFGRDGIVADGQLFEQKRALSARAEEIQRITNSLELEYAALKKDPDVIAAFARKIGYVAQGEKLLKINGLVSSEVENFDTGAVLKITEPFYIPEWFCKFTGFLVFFVVYSYLYLEDIKQKVVALRSLRHRHSKDSSSAVRS